MIKGKSTEEFKRLLDDQHEWPCHYTFKFIVPSQSLEDLKLIFIGEDISFSLKDSSGGKYVSLTVEIRLHNSDAVLEVYQKAAQIEGIISL